MAGGSDLAQLFEVLARTTGGLLGADAAGVLQLDTDGPGVRLVGAWSQGTPLIELGTHYPDVERLSIGAVLLSRQPSVSVSYEEGSKAALAVLGYRSALSTALCVQERVWGALTVASTRSDAFTDDHSEQLQRFAELLGLAVARIEDRQRLAEAASKDALTDLLNHRSFHERLSEEVQRANRHNRSLAIALIDVDEFKTVNDTFGHQQGDQVLRELADGFRHQARIEDVVARLGGDEFGLLMPDTSKEQAALICQRLREAFGPIQTQPVPPVTLSVGITDLAEALSSDGMIRLADRALYWSKASGRDQVCVYDAEVVRDLSADERAEQLSRSHALLGLRALAQMIDAKEESTRGHSDRVSRLAGLLAEQLRWHPGEVALLREAAALHDVGKLGVPDAVLLKPGRLTEDEYEQIKAHAARSTDIVGDVLIPRQAEWIRYHHERPDGCGYPAGLFGEEIPAGAALLALAEAWDAMTVSRSYELAKAPAEALEECRNLTDRQFSAEAVDALAAVIARGLLEGNDDHDF